MAEKAFALSWNFFSSAETNDFKSEICRAKELGEVPPLVSRESSAP
jgi:hypothetical protein